MSLALLNLIACGQSDAPDISDGTGQKKSELVVCPEHLLPSTLPVSTLYPDPADQYYSSFGTSANIIAWFAGQSSIRDGLCGSTSATDCAQVRVDGSNYYLTLTNQNSSASCTNFYNRLDAFLANGAYALTGVNNCMNAAGGTCWNQNDFSWEPNWRMFLPLGMPLINHKVVTLGHYPPLTVYQYHDYLDAGNTTEQSVNRRWTSLGATTTAAQWLLETMMDAEPIAAYGYDVNLPDPLAYFDTPGAPYIKNQLNWLLSPPTNTNANFALPVITWGSTPATDLVAEINSRTSPSSLAWSYPSGGPGSYLQNLQVAVTSAAGGVGGKKIAMLGSYHPNTAQLATCTPNVYDGQLNPFPMQAEASLQTAFCWQQAMGAAIAAGSNPDPVAVLNSCSDQWITNPTAANLHTLCKLAVQDYTPVTILQVVNSWPTQIVNQDTFRCQTDAQADQLCNILHDNPCQGYAPVAGYTNLNCSALPATVEKVCNDGLDNDGDGKTDCADADCDNATNCDAGDGDCGQAHSGNGCTDEAAENYVCACDSACCTAGWDAVCVTEFMTAKTADPTGSCTAGYGGVSREKSCTDGYDDTTPPNGKIDCADAACALHPACRNGTSDGDCVTVHGGKGCSYKTDQWYICNAYGGSGDAHCCTTAWDSTCVAEYRASFQYQESRAVGYCDDNLDNDGNGLIDRADPFCKGKPGGTPARSCCVASATEPGCHSLDIARAVCATTPSCCTTAWTSSCVAAYNAMAQYDLDSDGTADVCERPTMPELFMWNKVFDRRADKSTGGSDNTIPYVTGQPAGEVRMTHDGTTAGYGSTLLRTQTQSSTSQYTVYFDYWTSNTTGSAGHGLSYFWEKEPTYVENNPSPGGDAMGFHQDNKGFAVMLDIRLGFIRVYGGTTQLASAAVAGLETGGAWKKVAIRVAPNQVEVSIFNTTTLLWESKLLYTHTTNWNSDARGTAGDHIGFGAGTSASFATEISLRNVSISTTTRAFITSATFTGNLGGLSGADLKCQKAADSASLGGVWKAWLSSATVDAKARMSKSIEDYSAVGSGTKIADNWADLTNSSIQSSINRNELGAAVADEVPVWTGTDGTGTKAAITCNSWTDATTSFTGKVGRTGPLHLDQTWTSFGNLTCNNARRLYCIEQPQWF